MICDLGATKLIWIYKETEKQFLIANISISFLNALFFLWKRFTTDLHRVSATSSQCKWACRMQGGILVVLCSLPKPSGICALWVLSTGWSCSHRMQKGTVKQGIRTHVWYVVPLQEWLTVCSHAHKCESREKQWGCSSVAFVQGVGEQSTN